MVDVKGAQTLLCRRMGLCVVRRLLSVSEKDHCGGGDDVILEMIMAFVIMIVVVMLSLMVLVPVTAGVMVLVITFLVLVSGLDNLSGPPRLCNWPNP
jgi:phosphotransferase system  glucose/maltose/N-acetylglucosamine-specific IIC component